MRCPPTAVGGVCAGDGHAEVEGNADEGGGHVYGVGSSVQATVGNAGRVMCHAGMSCLSTAQLATCAKKRGWF